MTRQLSAGGLVFKRQGDGVVWLIRRPNPGENYRGNLGWSFPKGWIDKGEGMEDAALREVKEEGGVKARIIKKLPTVKVFFTDETKERVMKFISYFVMEYEGEAEEGVGWETAEVRWVNKAEAETLLAFKNDKRLLGLAEKEVV